jgi:predicted ester cyclase
MTSSSESEISDRAGRENDAAVLVRRLVDEVMVGGDFDVLPELVAPEEVEPMRRWIEPFRRSFPDIRIEILVVVVEGESVAAHFRCSGTHFGPWRGHEPTGASFKNVDELYFFRVIGGRLHGMVSVEDNQSRLSQLGL